MGSTVNGRALARTGVARSTDPGLAGGKCGSPLFPRPTAYRVVDEDPRGSWEGVRYTDAFGIQWNRYRAYAARLSHRAAR